MLTIETRIAILFGSFILSLPRGLTPLRSIFRIFTKKTPAEQKTKTVPQMSFICCRCLRPGHVLLTCSVCTVVIYAVQRVSIYNMHVVLIFVNIYIKFII